jgi:hypothetical protein
MNNTYRTRGSRTSPIYIYSVISPGRNAPRVTRKKRPSAERSGREKYNIECVPRGALGRVRFLSSRHPEKFLLRSSFSLEEKVA